MMGSFKILGYIFLLLATVQAGQSKKKPDQSSGRVKASQKVGPETGVRSAGEVRRPNSRRLIDQGEDFVDPGERRASMKGRRPPPRYFSADQYYSEDDDCVCVQNRYYDEYAGVPVYAFMFIGRPSRLPPPRYFGYYGGVMGPPRKRRPMRTTSPRYTNSSSTAMAWNLTSSTGGASTMSSGGQMTNSVGSTLSNATTTSIGVTSTTTSTGSSTTTASATTGSTTATSGTTISVTSS
ncbi:uncharacterized protein LOC132193908 [Neocloeon triangulifer]|uniref:uncharacterized protein LOC132193908 n=1 Tax=Neocloeon triangulifer TaxID=2078957 RepID=UPI00286F7E16|nr:uncharacterized protein LOC132193908 [Neocloeon triangulifer]